MSTTQIVTQAGGLPVDPSSFNVFVERVCTALDSWCDGRVLWHSSLFNWLVSSQEATTTFTNPAYSNLGGVITSPPCVTDALFLFDFGAAQYVHRRLLSYIWADWQLNINGSNVTRTAAAVWVNDQRTATAPQVIHGNQTENQYLGLSLYLRPNVAPSSVIQPSVRYRIRALGQQTNSYNRTWAGARRSVSAIFLPRGFLSEVTP